MTSESDRHQRQSRAWRLAALFVMVISSVDMTGGVALALSSDADRATARSLAQEGYEAQRRGDYAVAADRFTRAEDLLPAPTLLLGLARAEAAMGRLVEAEETYRRIVREGVQSSAPEPFLRALEDARHEAVLVAPRIAWITIDVLGAPHPSITVDGALVPTAAIGVRRPYDPGPHTVHVSASGFAPIDEDLRVEEGEARTLTFTLRPAGATATAATHSSAGGTRWPHWLGGTALGLGASALLVGGVAGGLALGEHADLANACPGGHCPPTEAHNLDTYHALADVSTTSLAVGAVLAVTGAVLLLSTHDPSLTTPSAAGLPIGIGGSF